MWQAPFGDYDGPWRSHLSEWPAGRLLGRGRTRVTSRRHHRGDSGVGRIRIVLAQKTGDNRLHHPYFAPMVTTLPSSPKVGMVSLGCPKALVEDRKSTRLNSSH